MIKAELIDHMGDDLRVVNAARVSFDKESEWDQVCTCGQTESSRSFPCTHGGCNFGDILSLPDSRLINYLARHNHFTPFTHCTITLRETVPISVARQRFKHVVGFTYNEVSRRYVSDDPEFYVPEYLRGTAENVKQGSSDVPVTSVEIFDDVVGYTGNVWDDPTNLLHCHHDQCLTLYKSLLKAGVCPEQARMILPQSMMTSYYVTGSLFAFARAYKQRSDRHSQKEIQDLAAHWDRIIEPLFPESWLALTRPHT